MSGPCGFHFESGGKCNVMSDANSQEWPQIGKVCADHELVLLRERDGVKPRVDLGHLLTNLVVPIPGDPEPGDWVVLFAQVKEDRPRSGRPEDITIEVFSTGDQYDICVRRDRIKRIQPPQGIAERCHHLRATAPEDPDSYYRCRSHLGHTGPHRSPTYEWQDRDTTGYLEAR